jgi:hypothetical protein
VISIAAMTTMLAQRLSQSGVVVGDGVAPAAVGWSAGTPNIASFVGYSVFSFNGASPTNPDIFKAEPEWQTNWMLRHYGGSRQQVDWVADQVRASVVGVLKETFGTEPFKVIGVIWSQLGGVSRNDQVDPPYWQAQDVFALLASRTRI